MYDVKDHQHGHGQVAMINVQQWALRGDVLGFGFQGAGFGESWLNKGNGNLGCHRVFVGASSNKQTDAIRNGLAR